LFRILKTRCVLRSSRGRMGAGMRCDRGVADQDDVPGPRGEEPSGFPQQGNIGPATYRSRVPLDGAHTGEGPVWVAPVPINGIVVHDKFNEQYLGHNGRII
jgi:hypothetical protein